MVEQVRPLGTPRGPVPLIGAFASWFPPLHPIGPDHSRTLSRLRGSSRMASQLDHPRPNSAAALMQQQQQGGGT